MICPRLGALFLLLLGLQYGSSIELFSAVRDTTLLDAPQAETPHLTMANIIARAKKTEEGQQMQTQNPVDEETLAPNTALADNAPVVAEEEQQQAGITPVSKQLHDEHVVQQQPTEDIIEQPQSKISTPTKSETVQTPLPNSESHPVENVAVSHDVLAQKTEAMKAEITFSQILEEMQHSIQDHQWLWIGIGSALFSSVAVIILYFYGPRCSCAPKGVADPVPNKNYTSFYHHDDTHVDPNDSIFDMHDDSDDSGAEDFNGDDI